MKIDLHRQAPRAHYLSSNFNLPKSVNLFTFSKSVKWFKYSLLFLTFLLSACQLNHQSSSTSASIISTNNIDYGQYYLELKQFTDNELLAEINRQKSDVANNLVSAKVKLLLLHSLPNSPVYNVYSAKTSLNEHFKNQPNYTFSTSDTAFFALLKDQLNRQLFLFQQLISKEMLEEQNQQKINNQQQIIADLEQKITNLEAQIMQLKKIEKNISGHGQ